MEEQKEEKRGRAGQKKEEAFPFFLYECILHTPTWFFTHTAKKIPTILHSFFHCFYFSVKAGGTSNPL